SILLFQPLQKKSEPPRLSSSRLPALRIHYLRLQGNRIMDPVIVLKSERAIGLRSAALNLAIEALLLTVLIAGFAGLAARKIGFYPPPWKDESWLMQPAYEVSKGRPMSLPR